MAVQRHVPSGPLRNPAFRSRHRISGGRSARAAPFPFRPTCAKHPPSNPAYPRSFVGVSHRSTAMVALTFPDGARREYPDNITGLDIAKGISPSLAKRTVAMALDGALADLSDPIAKDAKIEFVPREDPRALELIRHDYAHV